MTKIKDVSRAAAHGCENRFSFARDRFGRSFDDECRREVPLQTYGRGDEIARFGQRGLPINAENVRTAGDQVRPVAVRAEGKLDDGNLAAEIGDDFCHPAA